MATAELCNLQDAIDAHKRNWTLEEHLICYKPAYRAAAAQAYQQGREMILDLGSIRKAENEIERRILTWSS